MHSSQNEQDNRYYAKFAKMAMVEPSDSQECLDFMKEAYRISEAFDLPVLFRTTTRVAHSKSLVTFGEREEQQRTPPIRAGRRSSSPPPPPPTSITRSWRKSCAGWRPMDGPAPSTAWR